MRLPRIPTEILLVAAVLAVPLIAGFLCEALLRSVGQ